jgi:ATP-dependent helicase/nuclease subunit A
VPGVERSEPPEVRGRGSGVGGRGKARSQTCPAAKNRRRGLARQTPSAASGGGRVKGNRLLGSTDDSFALDRGTLIHAWFEQIAWLDDGPPDEQTLWQIAASMPNMRVSIDKALADFERMLTTGETARILRRDHYEKAKPTRIEVHRERSFALRVDDTLVQGSIDRLVLLYRGEQVVSADIVDYKTDAVAADDPASLAEKTAHYRPQLEMYRTAVAHLTGLPAAKITARLLFVGPGISSNI